jgi:hypothetical protein
MYAVLAKDISQQHSTEPIRRNTKTQRETFFFLFLWLDYALHFPNTSTVVFAVLASQCRLINAPVEFQHGAVVR